MEFLGQPWAQLTSFLPYPEATLAPAWESYLWLQAQVFKRVKVVAVPTLGFSKEDKEWTFQLHDDALMVTLQISGYDVKRVLVD